MSYWPPPPERHQRRPCRPSCRRTSLAPCSRLPSRTESTHCFSRVALPARSSVSLPSPAPTDVGTRAGLRHTRRRHGERTATSAASADVPRSGFASSVLLLDHEFHVRAPAEPDALASPSRERRSEDVSRFCCDDRQLAAAVERDDELRDTGRGRRRPLIVPGSPSAARRRREDRIFSGPHGERAPVPLEDVRRADEAGDELGLGMLVHLRRACPTCSIRPWLKTAIRSLIVSASSWSCVT